MSESTHQGTTKRPLTAGCLAAGVIAVSALVTPAAAFAATTVQTLESTSIDAAAQTLVGDNVTLASAELTRGRQVQVGTFTGLTLTPEIGAGVALTTGSLRGADPASADDVDFSISALVGPNKKLTTTADLGGAGSAELTEATGETTYDAAQVTLRVIPAGDELTLVYQFGSEEYGGWADRDYTDALGVFVDGALCSVVDGEPAGIATINDAAHADLYRSNATETGPGTTYDTEFNGFTEALTCTASVEPGEEVSIVAAVGDTRDGQLDTTLLLAADGITSTPAEPTPTDTPTATPTPTPTGTVTGAPTTNPGDPTGGGAVAGDDDGPLPRTGGDAGALAGVIVVGVILAAAGTGLVVRGLRRRRGAAAGTASTEGVEP